MISRAEVDKLLEVRAAGPSLLSLYVQVPLDPAELRGLPAHAGELFALAARDGSGIPPGVRVGTADARAVRGLLASRARDWLGHTVAVFACAGLGLAEAIPLPCRLQERAVLATRPHVRPLLLAMQCCPAYRVAVVNRRHAWLFSIADGQISTAVLPPAEGMRSHGFSGWYGLQAHRVNERIIQLARHHYHDIAALLDRAARASGTEPLVIGGHQDTIPQFLAVLPAGLRDQFAGSFVADPHTLTPAKVRDLADRLIQDWRTLQDQRIVAEFRREPPDGRTVSGLSACLAAVGQHAVQLLLVPAGGLVPGYACQRCGALSSTGDGCPHGATESLAVPDLIEELAVATLGDGGQVETLLDPPGGIAARLRYALRLRIQVPRSRWCCPARQPDRIRGVIGDAQGGEHLGQAHQAQAHLAGRPRRARQLGHRVAAYLDDIVEEPDRQVYTGAEPAQVHSPCGDEAGQVERAEVAGLIGQQRHLLARLVASIRPATAADCPG